MDLMPLAEFGDFIWGMIPLTALLIPIVAILVHHQQKMAQIIHGSNQRHTLPNPEIDQLRREVRELKELVHQQTLAIDSAQHRQPLTPPDPVAQRLTEV